MRIRAIHGQIWMMFFAVAGLLCGELFGCVPTAQAQSKRNSFGELAVFTLDQQRPLFLTWGLDGRFLVCRTNHDVVKVWNLLARKEIWSFYNSDFGVSSISLGPDGSTVLVGGARLSSAQKKGEVLGYDLPKGQLRFTITDLPGRPALSWNSQGNRFALRCAGADIRIWDARTNNCLQRLGGPHPEGGYKIGKFSPCGTKLAIADDSGTFLWDPKQNNRIRLQKSDWQVWPVFSADGMLLAATELRGGPLDPPGVNLTYFLTVWEARTGNIVYRHEFKWRHYPLCFSPDKGQILTWDHAGKALVLIDLKTSKPLERVPIAPQGFECVATHDGRYIALACDDNKVRVYEWRRSDAK